MNKSTLVSFGGVIVILFTTIQTILVTRNLGPVDVGEYAIFRQFCLFGTQLVTLGIPYGVIYFLNTLKKNQDEILYTNLQIHLILSFLYCIILFLFKRYLKQTFPGDTFFFYLTIAVLYSTFIGARNLLYNILLTRLNVKVTFIIDVIPVSLSFLFISLCIYLNLLSLEVVIVSDLIIIPLIGFIIGIRSIKSDFKRIFKVKPRVKLFVEQLKYGLWINLADVITLAQFYIVLKFVYKYGDNFSDVGHYTRAFSIVNILTTTLMFTMRYYYANWASLNIQEKSISFLRKLVLSFCLSSIFAFVISIFSDKVVVFLFGKQFLSSGQFLSVLIISTPFYIIYLLISSFNNSMGKFRSNVLLSGSSLLFLYFFCWFLSSNGIRIIANVYVVTCIFLAVISLIQVKVAYGISISSFDEFKVIKRISLCQLKFLRSKS